MTTGSWAPIAKKRLSRRRILAASGALPGALLLAACGGGDDSKESQGTSGIAQAPEDTSKQAKKGGTLVRSYTADVVNMDPMFPSAGATNIIPFTYNRLTKLQPGTLAPADGTVAGDLAESWEWSADSLQLTLKLRQDAKFHPIAPVNGRAVTMDDVVFSVNRQIASGAQRGQYNSVNPAGLILSVTPTDARTLVLKLKSPMANLLNILATPTSGHLHILPKEVDGGFDIRTKPIGSGPFMLRPEDYVPSVGFTFKRHPEYFDKERPYVDELRYPILSEYASALAQFKTGAIHSSFPGYPNAIRAEDMLPTKRDQPSIVMSQSDLADLSYIICFGHVPGSIFNDERVRKAYSMSFDRDLFIDVNFNVENFRKEGLPVDTGWSSSTFPIDIFKGWWLNPQDKDFGSNAQFFKHDLAEAKKLLAAAGFASGTPYKSTYFTEPILGPDYTKRIDVTEGMVLEGGFTAQKNIVPNAEYSSAKWRDAKGKYEGVTYRRGPGPVSGDAAGWLSYHFHSQGDAFLGFDVNGKGDNSGDPTLDAQISKVVGELDANKRRSLTDEIQRYVAGKMYSVRWAGGATSFAMAWPAIKNFNVFRGGGAYGVPPMNLHEWIDPSLPPFKTS